MPSFEAVCSWQSEVENERFWFAEPKKVAADGESTTIAVGGSTGTLYLLTLQGSSLEQTSSVSLSHRTIRRATWSPQGSLVAVACFEGEVVVVDGGVASPKIIAQVPGHESEVKGVAWAPALDEATAGNQVSLLATCGRDKSVWLWEVEQGEAGGDDDRLHLECLSVGTGHAGDVKSVEFGPRCSALGPVLLSASYDDTIRVWAPQLDASAEFEDDAELEQEWACVGVARGHTSTVWDLAVQHDIADVLSVSADGSIRRWTPASTHALTLGAEQDALSCTGVLRNVSDRPLYSIARYGEWFVVAGGDNNLRLFADRQFRPIAPEGADAMDAEEAAVSPLAEVANAHASDVNSVRLVGSPSTDSAFIVTTGDDGAVRVWKVNFA
jgi:WD40 repeat protein